VSFIEIFRSYIIYCINCLLDWSLFFMCTVSLMFLTCSIISWYQIITFTIKRL